MSASAGADAQARRLPFCMRRDLHARRQQYRGRAWWTLKDPVALRYFQLREEEFSILRWLDGQRSARDILAAFQRQFAPRQLDIHELHSFLGSLHERGLVTSDGGGQAAALLSRGGTQRRARMLDRLFNPLAMRFRGVDPQRFLDGLYPYCRWMASWPFLWSCFLLVLSAVALVALRSNDVVAALPEFNAFFNVRNALWLAAVLAGAKVIHELAHALTCRHFGGECHEIGVMLLVFTPCLYCNVSDAWLFTDKWRRAAVGAAGIAVELVLASAATWLWWFSAEGLFHTLCLNLMFVCSVSTVCFNGNPLLRYDGYYVLSDLLETPNLQQRSMAALRRGLAGWLGFETPHARSMEEIGGWPLRAYGLMATAYRWFVTLAILWFCSQALKPYGMERLGQALAAVTLAAMLARPAYRAFRYFSRPATNVRIRWSRLALRGGVVLLLLSALLATPLPHRIGAPVVLEPHDARRVYVTVPGTLVAAVEAGQGVNRGDVLARLQDLELAAELARIEGARNQQRLRLFNLQGRRNTDAAAAAQIPAAAESLADIEQRLLQKQEDHARLLVRSPIDGVILPPPRKSVAGADRALPAWEGSPLEERNRGCYLSAGSLLCLVGDPGKFNALAISDQADMEYVRPGQRVRVLLDESPERVLWGTLEEVSGVDLETIPPALLASGELSTRAEDEDALRPLNVSYQARVAFDGVPEGLVAGAVGQARIEVDAQPIARRLYRWLCRTFAFDGQSL